MTPEGLVFCIAVLLLGLAAAIAVVRAESDAAALRRARRESTLPDFVNGDTK